MKLLPWLVVLSMSLTACSGSKSAQKVEEESPQIELSDADEFIENPSEEPVADASVEDTSSSEVEPGETAEVSDESEVAEEPMVTDSEAPLIEEASPEVVTTTANTYAPGTMLEYKVQKNETLMMIAFKLYGDYGKWKKLAGYNQKALNGGTVTRVGMTLQYAAPSQEFIWNPQGLPYLIRTGDTLGHISKNVYTTTKKWKLLWENNRPLIKDPNKIFSGFTIYYLENGREVASEI